MSNNFIESIYENRNGDLGEKSDVESDMPTSTNENTSPNRSSSSFGADTTSFVSSTSSRMRNALVENVEIDWNNSSQSESGDEAFESDLETPNFSYSPSNDKRLVHSSVSSEISFKKQPDNQLKQMMELDSRIFSEIAKARTQLQAKRTTHLISYF